MLKGVTSAGKAASQGAAAGRGPTSRRKLPSGILSIKLCVDTAQESLSKSPANQKLPSAILSIKLCMDTAQESLPEGPANRTAPS